MIPWTLLDTAETPDGDELSLFQRGDELSLRIEGREVMNSRMHSSEDALAELACASLVGRAGVRVLIGGLGMGFTLAAALAKLDVNPDATLVVAELIPEVVRWNRGPLAEPAGAPLDDARVEVREQDVIEVIRQARDAPQEEGFDAIMLDVDNSPDSLIQRGNRWLYTDAGLSAIRGALRNSGVLTVWSVAPDKSFTKRLRRAGFTVDEKAVRARGAKGARHQIWVAGIAGSARNEPGKLVENRQHDVPRRGRQA